MENNFSSGSQKIIIAVSCAVALILGLLILNKIETTPQQIPTEAQSVLQISRPSSPEEALAPADLPAQAGKEVPVVKEYPKQVIIGLKSWSDVESAKKIIVDNGGQIIKILKWPTKNVIIANLPDKNSEQGILKNSFWGKLVGGIGFTSLGNKLSGGVDYVGEDIKVPLQAINSVDWGVARIGANRVWDVSTGKGVKVAVIDSGIQRDHPDLIANLKGGINFTSSQSDEWDDDNGHGTEVAGLIAAVNNDIGYVGVAPEASLYAVKVSDKDGLAAVSDMISGIYWAADNGMDVANLSIGVYMDPNIYSHIIDEETVAVNYAYAHGVVLVASSGNNPAGNCSDVVYPAAISSSVIAVGATTQDNSIGFYSCYGPEVELTAPGYYNWAPGLNGSYAQHSGTSVSAPFVSGVAALILSKNPQFTPAQVRERLDSTAIDLGASGKDDYYGYGLVNAYESVVPTELPVTINLVSPKGGEQWWEGTEQEVKWLVNNEPAGEKVNKVDIQLIHQHDNASEIIPLALDTANDGSLLFNVPTGLPGASATDSYFIQVSCGKEYLRKCQLARSGPLNIMVMPSQALRVISPNGGEKWPQGTIQSVLWTGNYFGGSNIDIDLLKKISVPTYLFSEVSQTNNCVDPLVFTCMISARFNYINHYWTSTSGGIDFGGGNMAVKDYPLKLPQDTCNGDVNKWTEGGAFFCPAENTNGNFTCTDVMQHKDYSWYWYARTVSCSYAQKKQTGLIDAWESVKTLAENIINDRSAEIIIPGNLSGNNYFIQLSCANFAGECAKGLSAAPFSIINLVDPVVLTINKLGAGAVTDGNISCVSNRSNCLENYERGTAVTLSAKPADPASIFTGWSGACSGTETCQITMGSNQSVTAVFSKRAVTLTAVPDLDTIFTGWSAETCLTNGQCFVSWSNACATSIPCNITMGRDQSVAVNFIKNPDLLVEKPNTGPASPGPGTGGGCSGDAWTCSSWLPAECPLSGIQTRTCALNCLSSTIPSPVTSQTCATQLNPGKIYEVRP